MDKLWLDSIRARGARYRGAGVRLLLDKIPHFGRSRDTFMGCVSNMVRFNPIRVGHVEVCEVCDYNQQHDFLKRVDFMEQLSDIREFRYKIRSKHS